LIFDTAPREILTSIAGFEQYIYVSHICGGSIRAASHRWKIADRCCRATILGRKRLKWAQD
jgi:hypothetical protein